MGVCLYTASTSPVGTSDFAMFAPISVTNSAEIRLFTTNDEITLEYDDRVLLMFTPDDPGLIPGLEGAGEYMRDTATVHIIDNDRKYQWVGAFTQFIHFFGVVLEINFDELDYSAVEGSTMLSSPIFLRFRENQNPFNLTVTAVTVDTVESIGLGFFVASATIAQGSRARAGTTTYRDYV